MSLRRVPTAALTMRPHSSTFLAGLADDSTIRSESQDQSSLHIPPPLPMSHHRVACCSCPSYAAHHPVYLLPLTAHRSPPTASRRSLNVRRPPVPATTGCFPLATQRAQASRNTWRPPPAELDPAFCAALALADCHPPPAARSTTSGRRVALYLFYARAFRKGHCHSTATRPSLSRFRLPITHHSAPHACSPPPECTLLPARFTQTAPLLHPGFKVFTGSLSLFTARALVSSFIFPVRHTSATYLGPSGLESLHLEPSLGSIRIPSRMVSSHAEWPELRIASVLEGLCVCLAGFSIRWAGSPLIL
ncbi:hypothetical protein GGX14DRAFT_576586 [Mycena pura]|uniref:Uncharacterized protein n=1 Tax=Mycena pura TaxID=153505 RepID=A0AAD6Y4S5_9AGAR|nr:hypothetical protein GGX14DRAFT_576586 [Mycena pura]